jgi:AraC-like DNA-binding protein
MKSSHHTLKEYRIVNISLQERLIPHHLPVIRLGTLPRKKQWVNDKKLLDCSFNIILSGSGYLKHGADIFRIKAPCMFTPSAFPGCTYGPDNAWEEFFIIYPGSVRSKLRDAGYLTDIPTVYYGIDIGRTSLLLNNLTPHMDEINRPGAADHIDGLCEIIIREAILSQHSVPTDAVYRMLSAIRDKMRQNFINDPDVIAIARKCGMSHSTFRRSWTRYFGVPPKRYVIGIRIERACSMLINSNLKINEISEAVGFADSLYFSKSFRKHLGMTPSQFRTQYL